MAGSHDRAALREPALQNVKLLAPGDVGLLFVAESSSSANRWSWPPEELKALEGGTPLVMTGYPTGGVMGTDLSASRPPISARSPR